MNQSSPPPCGGTSSLTDADRRLIARAAELQALRGPDQVRQWAGAASYDVASTLSAFAAAFSAAQAVIGDLAALVRRLDDDDDEDIDYRCATCKATIGIFIGHGDGWHHYRGAGTADSPTELYDAGHPATLTGLLP